MTILYSNTHFFSNEIIDNYLMILPNFMRIYINKFFCPNDRKQRLIARLLLRQALLQTTGEDTLLNHWKSDDNYKPYIDGWQFFNISHSGKYVVLVYDESPIGIDIEENLSIDYQGISEYFNFYELDLIAKSSSKLSDFYNIWTKKESLLKASGSGITKGLRHFSCIHESIYFEGSMWNFTPIPVSSCYTCYICSNNKIDALDIQYVVF